MCQNEGFSNGQQNPHQGSCNSVALTFSGTDNKIDSYCYDASGNLLDPSPCVGNTHQNIWDGYGNLLSGNGTATDRSSYTVNAEHQRLAKWTGSTLQRMYLYGIDGNPVSEMDGSGNWQQTNVRADGMFLAEYQGSDTYFQHADHLGTIRAQTNSAGTRTMTCSNLPFGDSLACNGSNNPPGYHFTGKGRDSESGNDYFEARYYASNMGRFLSPDPSRLSILPTNPQTWNRYSYVYNNPIGLKDENGKWPTQIHNQIIDKAFPNLTPAQRQILKNVSATQDGLLYGGQGKSLSFEHAMRGPNQSVADAQAKYNDFVSGMEKDAQTQQMQFWMADPDNRLDNLSDASLAAFGAALHAILDSTSPAHAGFQVWDYDPTHIWAHHNNENSINAQQMQNAVNAARSAFNFTFGLFGVTVDNSSVTTTQGPVTPCGGNTGHPCLK